MKFLTLIFLLTVSSFCFAEYRCNFKISQIDELDTFVGKASITAGETDLKTFNISDFVVEKEGRNKKISLVLRTVLDGWKGEEEIYFSIQRRIEGFLGQKSQLLLEKVNVRGTDEKTIWFDGYKLDVNCKVI